ncbi:hypothetical protein CVT24_013132 [Panaeolus cyanescens]|uniref:N-acetylglucosaminylphosphatidylinositol deacetylase n=1 Tax=Panaeolus cyanescens TaxID=181874 RepID=A0A409VVU8_9AGAR|nr:hypothetical protein CVT24_013132 [Panaeolus cyanescens]
MLSTTSIVVAIIAIVFGSLFTPLNLNNTFISQQSIHIPHVFAKKILLVTAHPDDEAMFFAPTITALTSRPKSDGISLFHVCLSTGDADGLGATRKEELQKSLDLLGLGKRNRWILDNPKLKDNITASWDPEIVASAISSYVRGLRIDTILTFDDSGVSQHPNHVSIPAGAQLLIENLSRTAAPGTSVPRLYSLVTSSLPTKYISLLAVPLAKVDIYSFNFFQKWEELILQAVTHYFPDLLTPPEGAPKRYPKHPEASIRPVFVSGFPQFLQATTAMTTHESQMVWFRWLYILFSRYMWVNIWTPVII